jgi:hypothetical protein
MKIHQEKLDDLYQEGFNHGASLGALLALVSIAILKFFGLL